MKKKYWIFFCLAFLLSLLTQNVHANDVKNSKLPENMINQTGGQDPAMPLMSEIFLEEGDYYLSRGKKIYLRRDANRMAVKFVSNTLDTLNKLSDQANMQSIFLQQIFDSTNPDTEFTVQKQLAGSGLTIISSKASSGVPQKLSTSQIQEISQTESVEYAYPVYTSRTGINEIIPTDEILVRFNSDYNQEEVQSFCDLHDLKLLRKSSKKLNVFVLAVNTPKYRSTFTQANSLNGQDGVLWSQPNFVKKINFFSVNDPLYGNQWHLENTGQGGSGTVTDADVDAEGAWSIQTGNPAITIAIVDDGVDLNHTDLDIWTNPGEIAGNSLDDDGNGYVDDIHGWNFYDSNNSPDADYDNNHGTACAGVAAAKGNNATGVAGIAYGVKVMAVKISGGADGSFTTEEKQGNAILYAADNADIISCSWGGGASSSYINDAIDYAVTSGRNGKGTPVFVATGNSAARGWLYAGISGFPAGDQAHAWVYERDANATTFGSDAAWIDHVTLQDGSLQTFDSSTTLPTDWNSFTGNASDWTIETNANHAYGQSGKSIKSGAVSNGQNSGVYVDKTYAIAGDLGYYTKVDAGEGAYLYTLYYHWVESAWKAYRIFYGKHISYPASYANSIAVGASTDADIQSPYSQYGDEIDFVAPSNGGVQGITTTDRTGAVGYNSTDYTNTFGGTSSATPLAAGIGALLLSKKPDLTASEIRNMMRNSCEKIGSDTYDNGGTGWNIYYGYGRVNAQQALAALPANGQPPVLAPINFLLLNK